jgi:hypothetical protein
MLARLFRRSTIKPIQGYRHAENRDSGDYATLGTAPAVADIDRALARCQLDAEHTYPRPDGPDGGYLELNKEQVANLKKRATQRRPRVRRG